jgi:hypothetical protein
VREREEGERERRGREREKREREREEGEEGERKEAMFCVRDIENESEMVNNAM